MAKCEVEITDCRRFSVGLPANGILRWMYFTGKLDKVSTSRDLKYVVYQWLDRISGEVY
jgi:hypothetical protein